MPKLKKMAEPMAGLRKLSISFVALCAFVGFATDVDAHPGGVDAAGGHVDRATGVYHFHRVGGPDGKTVQEAMTPAADPQGQTDFPETRRIHAARENAAKALLKSAQQSTRRIQALRAVAELFGDTDAGERAGRIADRLDPSGDEALTAEQKDELAAQQRLDIARQLMQMKQTELAIEILKETVAAHPKTKAAEKADSILHPEVPNDQVELPDGGFFEKRMQDLAAEEAGKEAEP